MPNKFNPDPLELVRAYHNRILSRNVECALICTNLITGYHRDFQLLKEAVMESFQILKDLLAIMKKILRKLEVSKENCSKSLTQEVMATHKVYEFVKDGVPFRDAYRKVANQYGGDKE